MGTTLDGRIRSEPKGKERGEAANGGVHAELHAGFGSGVPSLIPHPSPPCRVAVFFVFFRGGGNETATPSDGADRLSPW